VAPTRDSYSGKHSFLTALVKNSQMAAGNLDFCGDLYIILFPASTPAPTDVHCPRTRPQAMNRKQELEILIERAKLAVMNAQEWLRVIEQDQADADLPRAQRALSESIDQLSEYLRELSLLTRDSVERFPPETD
jgi:hypothetical protein